MSSALDLADGRLIEVEETPEIAKEFLDTLRMLPQHGRDEALCRLMTVIAQHERTDDPTLLEHYLRSLLMTAYMEQDEAYLLASAEPEAQGEPRDVADVIAGIEACHRGPGA
jgi:hypothetical protein